MHINLRLSKSPFDWKMKSSWSSKLEVCDLDAMRILNWSVPFYVAIDAALHDAIHDAIHDANDDGIDDANDDANDDAIDNANDDAIDDANDD